MTVFSAINVEYLSWVFQNNCHFIYVIFISSPFSVPEKRGKIFEGMDIAVIL